MNLFVKSIMVSLMLALLATPAFAQSAETTEDLIMPVAISNSEAMSESEEEATAKYLRGEAIVKSIFENGNLLVMVNEMEVALNISEATLVLDAKTGYMGNLEDLKEGDFVYVYYSPAMTRSLPPQSFATAVIMNIEKDETHPELFTIKEVVSSSDDEVRILNEEGDLIATISKDTTLLPFKTKQMLTLQDIEVGTQLFIWYEIVALSYPGQTQVQKAVIIEQNEVDLDQNVGVKAVNVPTNSNFTEKISINGILMNLEKQNWFGQNGHVMVPLRTVAERLGFEVIWDSSIQGVYLDDGDVKTRVLLGQDSYFKASSKAIGMTQSFQFGAKTVLVEDVTYVPVELFNLLYSNDNAVEIHN